MKVGTDGVLLGCWAESPSISAPRVLDIGTGTGLIALMMAQRLPGAEVVTIDCDEAAARQAAANVAGSPFCDRVSVEHASLQEFTSHYAGEAFDVIVSNPPYFTSSLKCPDPQRTLARHADTLPLSDLMHHAARLLSPVGKLSLVLPSESAGEAETEALMTGLRLARLWQVSTKEGKPPRRVLIELALNPTAAIDRQTLTLGSDLHKKLTEAFLLPKP